MSQTISLSVSDISVVGEARRQLNVLTSRMGFNETERGKAAIVVTEAANNIVLHAGSGQLLFSEVEHNGVYGVQILALDKGPGMANVEQCLRDGYSTAGTLGAGLGAIRRLSNRFDIYTGVGMGVALLSRMWSSAHPRNGLFKPVSAGAVSVCYPGEQECGDSWAIQSNATRTNVMLADGLGHGPGAAEASREAIRIFQQNTGGGPRTILEAAHDSMRATRGAAAAVAAIDHANNELVFAGIGNISACIAIGGETRSLVSHNGTIGHQTRKIQEFVYPLAPGALIVLHSDGIANQWRLDRYPGLVACHPGLIAGVLYRDFQSVRDDATIVVIRNRSEQDDE